jgi:hypothetical protein
MHNEELHNLYSSSNINRMIKSRRMRWAGLILHLKATHTLGEISVVLLIRHKNKQYKKFREEPIALFPLIRQG